MNQIYNVLIMLAITLLMALVTAVITYFADLVPSVIDGTQIASNKSVGASQPSTR